MKAGSPSELLEAAKSRKTWWPSLRMNVSTREFFEGPATNSLFSPFLKVPAI